ncbi:MAG: hypothetical protein EKK37_07790 [Sphingobacteriales bacterium]|nr:MAG: hypothetical protein EKK37_07790 [Sphingobacteriales bacterium]
MAGISSKAMSFGNPENKKKYNGIEYENSFDINIGETFFRTHDPQLGRWWQVDPKPNENLSPYCAMNNNPMLLSDPMGDTTWLYNQNGIYLGLVPDKLKNQVHYMKTEGDPGAQINTKGLSKKEINELGKSFRQNSIAFIGNKTVSDMRKINAQSMSLNREVGFVGNVGKDKEIRLTALPADKRNASNNAPLESQIDTKYPTAEQQSNLFLFGHTHLTHGWTTPDPNPQSVFGEPSPNSGNRGDFGNFLYRNNNTGEKGPSPALVVTQYGVTVYGSKQDASNISYLLYKSLK